MKIKKLSLLLILIFISSGLKAQSTSTQYEVGAFGSVLIYDGDLTQYAYGDRKSPSFGGGIFGSKRLFSSIFLRANLVVGTLKGDDANYSNPNFTRHVNFRTPITEVSGLLVWKILNFGGTGNISNSLYVMGGLGYSFLNIEPNYSDTRLTAGDPMLLALEEDMAETLPRSLPVALIGLGVRRMLTDKLSINAELLHRFTSTDYLDGVSEAGNPDNNDFYYSFSAGLIYSFEGSKRGNQFKRGKGRRGKIECPAYE